MNKKNITTRYHGHKGNKKNAKHEKHMKCMQKEHYLTWGIEGGVEEDVDRSTHVSSKQKVEKRGLMGWGGIKMLKTWIFMQVQYETYAIIKTQHHEPT